MDYLHNSMYNNKESEGRLMNIEERFLKYISFDTQSDPQSSSTPSSMKQLELGKYLVEEMKRLVLKMLV